LLRRNPAVPPIAVLVGVMAISSNCSYTGRTASYSVVNESGARLSSIFEGVRPFEKFVALAHSPKTRRGCASKSNGVWSRFAGLFSIRSVEAQSSCGADQCNGAYMMVQMNSCGGACGGGSYATFYSNPYQAGPYSGYQYTGGTTCPNNCGCAEGGCTVPGGSGGPGGGGPLDGSGGGGGCDLDTFNCQFNG
jgi:hypothetical protein